MAVSLVGSAFAEDTSVASTTQSAANVAQVVQTGSISSGDAVAFPGAKATTGDVKVEVKADVSQTIDQDAHTSATGGSLADTEQAARNTANVAQNVVAGSGDATASGYKSQASSGDVYVNAKVEKDQKIEQEAKTEASASVHNGTVSVGSTPASTPVPPVITPGLAITLQAATNTDIVLQAVAAQSGGAFATGPWTKAESGDLYVKAKVDDDQKIEQNDGKYGGESEAEGGKAFIQQTASQTNNAVQGIDVASGFAVALVTEDLADGIVSTLVDGTSPCHWYLATAETGDVNVEAEIEQDQDIEQDADAYASLDDEKAGTKLTAAVITQAAFNTAIAYQVARVYSGGATAIVEFLDESDMVARNSNHYSSGTKASSGDVYVEFDIDIDQDIDQEADATAIGSGAVANVDQDVDADAANHAEGIQGLIISLDPTIVIDPIKVYSGEATAFGEDWDGSWDSSGDVGTWKCWIPVETDIYQSIDQEADSFAGSGVYCL